MAVRLSEFLQQFFMQLRFNNMPPEVRAKFDAWAKTDDFRGNMKNWTKYLMHTEDGKRVQNDLPDPSQENGDWELSYESWEEFYNAFKAGLEAMAAQRSEFKDNKKATDFLDEWFGNDRLFNINVATPELEEQIEILLELLEKEKDYLEINFQDWHLTGPDFSYSDLIRGIKNKKYNTDINFQSKLKNVARSVRYYSQFDENLRSKVGKFNSDLVRAGKVPSTFNVLSTFEAVREGFDDKQIEPDKMAAFQVYWPQMLRTLAKESKVYEVFSKYDSGRISKYIDVAKEKVAYDNKDSKDYIPPKRTDELTLGQQIKKWTDDTYADIFEKFGNLRGDRLIFNPTTKTIVDTISGLKIKPTDGLDGIVDKAADIKKKILYKSPTATDDFDYFVKVMTDMKETMPKAYAGALYNGHQLRRIVEEVIRRGVREGKVRETKVILEILSVVKYGWTTSKVMDALKKQEFTIFSDKSLSWNKNDGMKFVMLALDKSLRSAFLGLGYGITLGRNGIRMMGRKFKGDSGTLNKAYEKMEKENAEERATMMAINEETAKKLRLAQEKLRQLGYTEQDIEAQQKQIEQRIELINDAAQSIAQVIKRPKNMLSGMGMMDEEGNDDLYNEIDDNFFPAPKTVQEFAAYIDIFEKLGINVDHMRQIYAQLAREMENKDKGPDTEKIRQLRQKLSELRIAKADGAITPEIEKLRREYHTEKRKLEFGGIDQKKIDRLKQQNHIERQKMADGIVTPEIQSLRLELDKERKKLTDMTVGIGVDSLSRERDAQARIHKELDIATSDVEYRRSEIERLETEIKKADTLLSQYEQQLEAFELVDSHARIGAYQMTVKNMRALMGQLETVADKLRVANKSQAVGLRQEMERLRGEIAKASNALGHYEGLLDKGLPEITRKERAEILEKHKAVMEKMDFMRRYLGFEKNRMVLDEKRMRSVGKKAERQDAKTQEIEEQFLKGTHPERMDQAKKVAELEQRLARMEHDVANAQKKKVDELEQNLWDEIHVAPGMQQRKVASLEERLNQAEIKANEDIDQEIARVEKDLNNEINNDQNKVQQEKKIEQLNHEMGQAYDVARGKFDDIYNQLGDEADRISQKSDELAKCQYMVQVLENQIKVRKDVIKEKDKAQEDKYESLMAYWDFMETGRYVRSWKLSKKKAQEHFDKEIEMRDKDGNAVIDSKTGEIKKEQVKEALLRQFKMRHGYLDKD